MKPTEELVATLLGSRAAETATEFLARADLRDLDAATAIYHGLTESQSKRLVAAIELGRKLATAGAHQQSPRLRQPEDAARYLIPRYGSKPLEAFGILVLNTRNRLKHESTISTGSLNGSLVHPREVYREAIVHRGAAIIAFHNHPSGDASPSQEDRELTRRLQSAGRILGVELLDHVIVTATSYWSFKEHGEL